MRTNCRYPPPVIFAFDTLEYVETLEKSGFTNEQSKALATLQKNSLNSAMDTHLATKDDINRLDKELAVIKWVSFSTFALVSFGLIKYLFAS